MTPSSFSGAMAQVFAVSIFTLLVGITSAQEAASGARPNLLTNASFEKGMEGWHVAPYHKEGKADVDNTEMRDGKPTLRISSVKGDDTTVTQKVLVKPKTRYRLTGYIKTKDVSPNKRNGKTGASLAVKGTYEYSEMIQKTKSWTKVTCEFESGNQTEMNVGPRLGHHAGEVAGTAWFSDLSVVELGKARR